MPPNVQLKKAEEDIAYKPIFSWDLDLNPVAPYTQKILLKDKVSFGGKWTLEIARTKDDLNIDINFLDAGRAGRFGDAVKVTGSFAWIQAGVNGREHTFRSMQWYASTPLPVKKPSPEVGLVENVRLSVTRAQFEQESQSSGGLFDPAAHRHFRLTFQLVQAFPDGGVSSSASFDGQERARLVTSMSSTSTPHDVRLFFPNAQKNGADLWTNADLLISTSPYFRTLFESDFAEASPRRGKRARKSSAKSADDGPPTVALPAGDDFADSDVEADELFFGGTEKKGQIEPSDDLAYRQITITQTSFSTYRALLVYLQTGFISFMPLSSSLPNQTETDALRKDMMIAKQTAEPSLPLPVSPKSMYRLAHLLQLPDLEKLCLESFASSLTMAGAPAELFSDTAVCYEDWRKVVLNYVAERWIAVQQSSEWKEMLDRQKREEIVGASAVLVELLQAVTGM